MSEWHRYRLDELCEFINGFAFKSTDYVPASVDTIEVFRMGYIERGGGFKEDDRAVFVPKKYGKKLDKYCLRVGDIAIAMTDMKDRVAILGNTAWIRDENRFVLNQRVGCIRVKQDDLLDPRFLYFHSNWEPHVDYLRSRANSGVQVNLATSAIKDAELYIPPLVEQRAIAHILGTLDDKIELNRKQNETLEAMARALFKAWFVDFEPVRAKMEGRWVRGQSLPGLPAHLFDLFPDKLVESELGEIPEGWEVSALVEVCSYLTRGVSPKYIDFGGVSVLNQKCIRDFSIDFSKSRRHDAEQKKIDGRALELGDVLVNSTGVGTLGRVAQVRRLAQTTIVDSHVTVVRAGNRINPMYLAGFMSMIQPEIEAMGEGSTGQTELSRTKLGALKILLPAIGILDHFSKHTKKFSESIATNQVDSEVLAQLRDTLLPKLISGELRVPEAMVEGII